MKPVKLLMMLIILSFFVVSCEEGLVNPDTQNGINLLFTETGGLQGINNSFQVFTSGQFQYISSDYKFSQIISQQLVDEIKNVFNENDFKSLAQSYGNEQGADFINYKITFNGQTVEIKNTTSIPSPFTIVMNKLKAVIFDLKKNVKVGRIFILEKGEIALWPYTASTPLTGHSGEKLAGDPEMVGFFKKYYDLKVTPVVLEGNYIYRLTPTINYALPTSTFYFQVGSARQAVNWPIEIPFGLSEIGLSGKQVEGINYTKILEIFNSISTDISLIETKLEGGKPIYSIKIVHGNDA